MNLILGVDPGLTGALAIYNRETNTIIDCIDTPLVKSKVKNKIDPVSLAMFLDEWAKKIKFCVIETVAARPGQGVVSMFTFGFVTGVVHGAVSANYIPVIGVSPQVWKGDLGLSSDKRESIPKAKTTMTCSRYFSQNSKKDGRAEAMLLAYFGAKHEGKMFRV